MTRTRKFLFNVACLAVLGLSACAAPFNSRTDVSDERLTHPISVAPQMETLSVPFDRAGAGLDPETDARVATFAKNYLENGNGALSLSVPRGDPDARRYFAQRLSQLGVPAWRILIGSNDKREVELSFIRYVADVPPCGDWSGNVADTGSNLPPPNFGCATQHNIAAMVADPRDFVAPHAEDPADAKRRMTVLDKYHKGEPTATQATDKQSATVATVGGQ